MKPRKTLPGKPNGYKSGGPKRLPLNAAPESLADSDDVRQRLLAMFTSGAASPVEMQVANQVTGILRDFESAGGVAAPIDVKRLVSQFTDSTIPTRPTDVGNYLDHLSKRVVSYSNRMGSPRCIGHMTTKVPYFLRHLNQLIVGMNQNMTKMEASRAFTPYERQGLAMMHRLVYNCSDAFYKQHIQNGASTLGLLVSGGTLANLTALWCARNWALGPKRGFPGVEREGVAAALHAHGYNRAVVVGSRVMHFSLKKAAATLGMGERGVIEVPTDGHDRIDLCALSQAIKDCQSRRDCVIAIVGLAGSTDSGAVDSLAGMSEIASEAGVHFHVDAAWGGPVLFSDCHRHKMTGIERADSVTIDAHKQMYLPLGLGMIMFREPTKAAVLEKEAPYMLRRDSLDLGKRALEGSRPGAALLLHAALSVIGRQGFAFLIEEGIRKGRYMADCIRQRPEFQLLLEPELNIVLYRCLPPTCRETAHEDINQTDDELINRFNVHLHKAQRAAGKSFVSRTTWRVEDHQRSVVALRAVIANPLTTDSDLDAILNEQAGLAAAMSSASE